MKLAQHVSQGRLVYLSNSADQISISENNHFRWLAFDDVIQSVMHLRRPEKAYPASSLRGFNAAITVL